MTIELEEPPLTSDNNQVLKDLFGGTMGGIAQVLVGQPFDTVKVRVQSAPEGMYSGSMDVIKQLVKNEGPFAFYKGTLTPLVGVGACVSVQFSVNEFMKRYYDDKLQGKPLSLSQFFVCGAVAGFANGFLASPIEHIRIRLQTQTGSASGAATFNGPIDCAKKLYQSNGFGHGIYRGLVPTLFRESVGLGIYFATYEALIGRELKNNKNMIRAEIPAWKLCLFGGLSGYTLWIGIYPVDVIKSKLQTDSLTKPNYKGSLSVVRDVFAKTGIKGFYKGFIPTILRAAPANGATFAVFELTMRVLG
ncbi:mitochondrial carrier protein [Spathaspora passalidarum NRRL Y-27907]|uniref:Mitochondrial thiamine pyrophosphate carrier 1 n=1 Tax=Spathaspora passalidarum (strain NRRL Y-27907 / 11-Y1) TaxID=619300 RepID=G3AG15_SPAPN|nr:mitochondrial carrier protein [Spathaspora passalidarum NRRL Y-27907]EGW35154.1 mitochondrial carrier protein [Spathaspora passalidarum NRRL Y-27907]